MGKKIRDYRKEYDDYHGKPEEIERRAARNKARSKKKKRGFFEDRLDALRKSAEKARSELSQQEGSEKSVSSENVYGQ